MGWYVVFLGWVFSFFYQSLKISLPYFVFARSLRSAYSFGFFEVAPAKESWGGGEENTDLSRRESRYLDCAARQIYGCFEMVLFPAKTRNLKVYLQSKNFKLHLLALSTHQIHYLIPPAALNLERFASSARERNGTVEISSQSKQPRNSVRTSFGCWSICLWEVCDYGVSGRRKRCGVNTAVSRRPLRVLAKFFALPGYSLNPKNIF